MTRSSDFDYQNAQISTLENTNAQVVDQRLLSITVVQEFIETISVNDLEIDS